MMITMKIVVFLTILIFSKFIYKSYIINNWEIEKIDEISTTISIEVKEKIENYFKNVSCIISFLLFKNYSAKIKIDIIFINNKDEYLEYNIYNNILINKNEVINLNKILLERTSVIYEKYKDSNLKIMNLKIKFSWIKDINYDYINNKKLLENFFINKKYRVFNLIKISYNKLVSALNFYKNN